MSREWRFYVTDMLDCCRKITEYSRDITLEDFLTHQISYDAILHNLGVLGESSANIPEDIKQRYPDVPWRKIKGLRNLIVHRYFDLEDETIWNLIQTAIPPLHDQLERLQRETQ